jgi:hypothetical protein
MFAFHGYQLRIHHSIRDKGSELLHEFRLGCNGIGGADIRVDLPHSLCNGLIPAKCHDLSHASSFNA